MGSGESQMNISVSLAVQALLLCFLKGTNHLECPVYRFMDPE